MLSRKEILTVCLFGALVIAGVLVSVAVYKKSIDYLPIREHPDLVLRRVAEPISQVDGSIISLAEDIVATLRYITLVDFFLERSIPRGLAAPQVGISKRLVVCGINGRIKVMVNPEILERRGTYIDRDGCLSISGEEGKPIKRSAYVKVKFNTLKDEEKILVVKNEDAALVEHEIDHLNGVLYIDY